MIYKVNGISGDVVVKLPDAMLRIGIFSYNLIRSIDEDPIASYHDCSTTPDDHWKGYLLMTLNNDLTRIEQKNIDRWDIKIHEEMYQNLIDICFTKHI